MRLIDADRLVAVLRREYDAHRADGDEITMYDMSYTLGDILEKVDSVPTVQFQIGNEVVELEEINDKGRSNTDIIRPTRRKRSDL